MRRTVLVVAVAVLALVGVAGAGADSLGPITFEPPSYSVGNLNGQNGWSKTGPYDAAVAAVSYFPADSGYGFGTQALRIPNAS